MMLNIRPRVRSVRRKTLGKLINTSLLFSPIGGNLSTDEKNIVRSNFNNGWGMQNIISDDAGIKSAMLNARATDDGDPILTTEYHNLIYGLSKKYGMTHADWMNFANAIHYGKYPFLEPISKWDDTMMTTVLNALLTSDLKVDFLKQFMDVRNGAPIPQVYTDAVNLSKNKDKNTATGTNTVTTNTATPQSGFNPLIGIAVAGGIVYLLFSKNKKKNVRRR